MASIPKPTVKSVIETKTSKKLPPSLEKFDETDPICIFCNKKQSTQDLLTRRAGNRFFQMVDKAPFNNNKKGQAFIRKSSQR